MKKTLKIITALILCVSLLMIPMQVMAAPAENVKKPLYISEVKVGMGETSEEAAKELLAEGFTIIKGDDGSYADLNEKAGTTSDLKKGPTKKIVYIGYKTTDDPKQAITDLAVMNMNGGYSVQDYEVLMANHLESEILPFVDRFIAALKEYRANYKKPKNTINYIRPNYYRQMLNKLKDDDTGKPLGDLLLNKTKYELGDKEYEALSDKEKKKHADIITILMQGNGRAVLLLETLISRATDSSNNTWLDRFIKIEPEDLKRQIKKENPSLTTEADIDAALDKKYNDTARKIYEKWGEFYNVIDMRDDMLNEVANAEQTVDDSLAEKIGKIDTENPTKEDNDTIAMGFEAGVDYVSAVSRLEEVTVVDYISEIEYEDGTLLDFFEKDQSVFAGEGIRSLYPIAAALSPGQIAGLDFLSITDLFTMALTKKEGYQNLDIKDIPEASFYQDVDRQIYEPGGVALTNAALRLGANAKDDDSDFMLSTLGFVIMGLTGVSGMAAIASYGLHVKYLNSVEPAKQAWFESFTTYDIDCFDDAASTVSENVDTDALWANAMGYATKSKVAYYFTIGFTVLGVLLAGYLIYTNITELIDYYKVTFTPIPKYIVDEVDITQEINGNKVVINNQTAYYKVVPCNRKEGSSDVEKDNYKVLGTSSDLNGDVGKQWLALYSVRYEYGKPILVDSIKVVKGTDKLPSDYETGIHRFGEKPAFNLTSRYYCYNDGAKGTYVYFKNGEDTVAAMKMKATETNTPKTTNDKGKEENTKGSVFSIGALAMGVGIGLLLGVVIAVLIILPSLKKKKEQQDDE